MFTKILVAYDDSSQAQKALEMGIQLTKENPSAVLHVIHVFYFPVLVLGEAVINTTASVDNDLYQQAEAVAAKAENKVSSLKNKNVILLQGSPAKTIIEYANQTNCDLIVVGSRGLGSISEVLLGSVSHYLAQHSKIPVLIVK